jgi:lipopolysaccharide/colanic/teichoic acid biosynthesis glycosyltransferase
VARRIFDIVAAAVGLLLTAPLMAIAAVGIRLTSPGPIFYPARRVGQGGRSFTMYKLRTMHPDHDTRSAITAANDPRVFPFGRLLRAAKLDELPQLWNVLRGDMSIVGPRPEDPGIVAAHYGPSHHATLLVRPGLTSPGTLFHDTRDDCTDDGRDAEARYLERVLPVKLAIDLYYVRNASLRYDLLIITRTLGLLAAKLAGRRTFRDPPELTAALQLLEPPRPNATELRMVPLDVGRANGRSLTHEGADPWH